MEFSSVGSVQPVDGGFRARVRWSINGSCKLCPGPRRPDEKTAKEDLQHLRASASGMGRQEGFAAIEAEAKLLRDGKTPTEEGSVMLFEIWLRRVHPVEGRGRGLEKPCVRTPSL